MDAGQRIDTALQRALVRAAGGTAPPQIAAAVRAAVFPGGARVRPRLCLAVADACGDPHPGITDGAAAAIELLHCASLVHDDLPCFDDAGLRRGRPTLHRQYGEPLALLSGDALIVLAFETIAREAALVPERVAPLIAIVGRAVGLPHGITAGQAWESEAVVPLQDYHRTKTGALFVGATAAGATAAGADPADWLPLGERLGEAYQVADDLRDATAEEAELGKPVGQDVVHARPNAVGELGVTGALDRLRGLVTAAIEGIPPCRGAATLEALILAEAKRLVPKKLAQQAA